MSDPQSPSHPPNRLAAESSPYLLQHAHNPVDWYAWGPEAFEAARSQDKPIFLSVGYSTCYWCHVMERQCFENPAVAAEMNQRFINIKVDREERPDVDQLYMTAVQVLTRHGGWPMSVFLTPDLRPFYGGTYFPPTDMHGRPGFVTIVRGIEDAYRNRPEQVEKTANQLVDILQQNAEPIGSESPIDVDDAFLEDLIRRSIADYDANNGGFGGAPKFPRQTLLELLLAYIKKPSGNHPLRQHVRQMVFSTLDALANGGIHDQLGGGFHRYSTDAHWLVPHFEIMLYDNAMLGYCYAEAFAQSGNPYFGVIARQVFDFILREMTSPDGAFYTAFDAEVDSQEGLNYLWTSSEIDSLLSADDAKLFKHVYGVDRGPNFADPHHGSGIPDKNILYLPLTFEKVAEELKIEPEELLKRLAPLRRTLLASRAKRKQPLLDTKIITSWNALMIRALAHGGKALAEPRYIEAAERAAKFLLSVHRMPDGGLYRTSRDGKTRYNGFLDDYAFLAQALLELASATGAGQWKDQAEAVAAVMASKFGDPSVGGFFFTEASAKDLVVRQKTASDTPLPSGNAVAAAVLLETGQIKESQATLALFIPQLQAQAEAMGSMLHAALSYIERQGPLRLVPQNDDTTVDADHPPSVDDIARDVVNIRTSWINDAELAVHLSIQPGFHISANRPTADSPMIPTTLAVDDSAATVDYPPGTELNAAFMDKPLLAYVGEVKLTVHWQSGRATKHVRLTLRYQACDDARCLPPTSQRIEAMPA